MKSASTALVALLLLLGACSSGGGTGAAGTGIGPAGGTVVSADGLAMVEIPPGALAGVVSITIRVAPAPPAGYVGTAYEFGPSGTTFASPVTITITYDEADLPAGAAEADVRLGTVVSGAWAAAAGSTVDTVANTVTGETDHFSPWAPVLQAIVQPPPPAGIPPIVFGTGGFEMFVYDAALAQADRLWQVNEDGFWPAWRNGVEIAYSGFVGANSAIKIMNVHANAGNVVFESAGRDAFQPAWSHDGTRIAFSLASADGLLAEIWVADANGSNARALTGGNYDVRATWSPNNQTIAFERDGQGIYKVPADGSSGATPLYVDPDFAPAAPHWGSNGIVFQAYDQRIRPGGIGAPYGYRVARVDDNGTPGSLRWLTWGGDQIGDYGPKWSPDGTKVLFVRERAGNNGIGTADWSAASPDPQIPGGVAGSVLVPVGGSEVLGADW